MVYKNKKHAPQSDAQLSAFMHWVLSGDPGPLAAHTLEEATYCRPSMSSDMVVGVDRPATIVAGGTPIGIGDRRPAVPIWGSGGGTAIPKLPIKGAANTAITVPTCGTVGTHFVWVMSK